MKALIDPFKSANEDNYIKLCASLKKPNIYRDAQASLLSLLGGKEENLNKTSVPASCHGGYSSLLQFDYKNTELLDFKTVAGKITWPPSNIVEDLRGDQRFLLFAENAVQVGLSDLSEETKVELKKNPGPLNNARWCSLANPLHESRESPRRIAEIQQVPCELLCPCLVHYPAKPIYMRRCEELLRLTTASYSLDDPTLQAATNSLISESIL
ncbi:hypothetical protein Ciccas_004883 [Cichlidogyrus casuarinus]|uniref:Uncharacterized protein n=1 Tax=Cichlidogyrus casuarinus TaxID=1844966 RepID=A0ABD2QAB6_9PLAT